MIRLLLVDEEIPTDDWAAAGNTPYMWYYGQAVRMDDELSGTILRDFANAKKVLDVSQINFDVVSLDVTMPFPGGEGAEIAKSGSRTGLALLDVIIRRRHNLPVILLSNIPEQLLLKDIPPELGRVKKLVVLEKIDTDPFVFVDQVKQLGLMR